MPDQTRFSPDKVAAHEFLEALDRDATTWTFQTFDDNYDRKQPSLAKVLNGTLDDHWETLCRYSDRGAGVFVTINETDGKDRRTENIMRVRAVWVDTDGADQAPIKAAYPDLIVESSPGNFHDYWLVEGCPLDEFRWAQKTLSEVWGTDAGVKDLSRVMRLPGFPHQKVDSKKGLTGNKFMVRMVGDMPFLGAEGWADRKEQIDKCLANKRATDPTPPLSQRALAGIHPPDTCDPTEISFADVGGPSEDEARELLGYIDPDVPYDQWLRVLMALHDAGDHMLPLAVEWSKRGEKYRPGEIERKWKGFKHKRKGFTRGTGVTWRTVPELARQGGADLSAIARRHKTTSDEAVANCVELVKGHTAEAATATIELLRRDPVAFDFGGQLALADDGRVHPLCEHGLAHHLGTNSQFWKRNADGEAVDADPPGSLLKQIIAQGERRRLKPLDGVITAPTIRLDGSVLDAPGYDAETRLLFDPMGEDVPPVPVEPTRDEADAALDLLLKPFAAFPVCRCDRSGRATGGDPDRSCAPGAANRTGLCLRCSDSGQRQITAGCVHWRADRRPDT